MLRLVTITPFFLIIAPPNSHPHSHSKHRTYAPHRTQDTEHRTQNTGHKPQDTPLLHLMTRHETKTNPTLTPIQCLVLSQFSSLVILFTSLPLSPSFLGALIHTYIDKTQKTHRRSFGLRKKKVIVRERKTENRKRTIPRKRREGKRKSLLRIKYLINQTKPN